MNRVLCVDDEPALLEITKVFLERGKEFVVDTTPSAKQALEMLQNDTFDAIVSDFAMPEMDGIDLLKLLRKEGNSIPFILFTGKGREEVAIEALNSGANFYLQKGGDPKSQFAELLNMIRRSVSRSKAEEGLRESEEKYRSVVERANDGIVIVQGREVVLANQAFASMSGYSLDEIIGMEFLEFLPKELHSKITDQVRRRLSGENVPATYEIDLLRKDGTNFSVEVNAGVVKYEGAPADLVILRDITERKQAKERVKDASTYARRLIEASLDPMFTINPEGIITDVNSAMEKATGADRGELVGSPFENHIAQKALAIKSYQTVFKEGSLSNYELEMVNRGGGITPVTFNASVYRDDTGKVVGIIAAARDITDRKRVEAALHMTEARFDQLAEQSNTVTWEADIDGLFTYVSSVSEAVWGYRPDELVGKVHFFDMVVEAERETVKSKAFEMLKHKERFVGLEHAVQAKDGRTLWNSTSGIPLLNADGSLRGYLGSDTDITDRKRAEETLQEKAEDLTRSNEELEQFAYVASHDLQEPLRMITSYLQLLDRRYKGKLDKDADEFIFYAVDGAKRLQTMINDLLQYSRVETQGKAFTAVDMNTAMGVVLNNLKVAIEESGGVVSSDPLPTVLADEAQMIMLLQNLVGNAIKYRKPDEKLLVSVSTVSSGQEWIFAVKDNGIGIDPAYHDRIFRVFQRLNPRSEYEGTGIGLAIAKRIVERHRGRIWLESELGKGSVFFFSIMKTGGK